MAGPLIAKELQVSFRLALAEAKRMRHEYLTLEHLLLALLKDAKTRHVLNACGANIRRLQKRQRGPGNWNNSENGISKQLGAPIRIVQLAVVIDSSRKQVAD